MDSYQDRDFEAPADCAFVSASRERDTYPVAALPASPDPFGAESKPTSIPFRAFVIAFKTSPRSALAALWARLWGKRVRARNIIYAAAHQGPDYYRLWTTLVEPQKMEAYCRAGPRIETQPRVAAFIFGGENSSLKDAQASIASLRTAFGEAATTYCDVVGSEQLGCIEASRSSILGEDVADPDCWLLPLFAGDQFAARAGEAIAAGIAACPNADIIYWDEDRLEGGNRADPWLKPEWDELLFLARDFVTGASLLKSSALLEASPGTPFTRQGLAQAVISLVSRSRGQPRTFHVPLILSHRTAQSDFASASERKRMIEKAWHQPVELEEIQAAPGTLRPRFMDSAPLPKVSILVPTRNRHDLLRSCIGGLAGLDYAGPIEIIVIDNDSDDSATVDYLARLQEDGVTILRYPGPFNFSAMNNRAAKAASGEVLCFLNNDVEMDNGSWLEPMVRHAMRPGTGAVGALLSYPDGSVQHAGISIGTGDAAGHVYRGLPVKDGGHRNMHCVTREVSAVTAACMVIRTQAFLDVGGFDECDLKVAFNDVDLCLKLLQRGYRNVFAGEACLTHHESRSRGSDFSETNQARYLRELDHLQRKWRTKGYVDPHSHPLVMRSSENFVLGP
jgi:GT2 family glycosyltransferase